MSEELIRRKAEAFDWLNSQIATELYGKGRVVVTDSHLVGFGIRVRRAYFSHEGLLEAVEAAMEKGE